METRCLPNNCISFLSSLREKMNVNQKQTGTLSEKSVQILLNDIGVGAFPNKLSAKAVIDNFSCSFSVKRIGDARVDHHKLH